MELKAALELLVAAINRGAWNPLERAGLTAAVESLQAACELLKPPEVKDKLP
jgi:hypothetical protein